MIVFYVIVILVFIWYKFIYKKPFAPLIQVRPITVMSHDSHAVWNHNQLDCLFNSLFRPTKKASKASYNWPFLRGIHPWWVDSPHKGPVMQEASPCHNIFMLEMMTLQNPRQWYIMVFLVYLLGRYPGSDRCDMCQEFSLYHPVVDS